MSAIPQTISTNLRNFTAPKLVEYTTTLLSGVTGNPDFPTLQTEVARNADLFGRFGTAVANAVKGGEAAKLLRNGLRPEVEAAIRLWSAQALEAKPKDLAAWADAHFNLTSGTRQSRPTLAAPTKTKLTDGKNKGSVCLRQNAQRSTRAYVYEYALPVAEGQELAWKYYLDSKFIAEITGLTSGQGYWFRMGAWNGTADTIFSEAEWQMVQ